MVSKTPSYHWLATKIKFSAWLRPLNFYETGWVFFSSIIWIGSIQLQQFWCNFSAGFSMRRSWSKSLSPMAGPAPIWRGKSQCCWLDVNIICCFKLLQITILWVKSWMFLEPFQSDNSCWLSHCFLAQVTMFWWLSLFLIKSLFLMVKYFLMVKPLLKPQFSTAICLPLNSPLFVNVHRLCEEAEATEVHAGSLRECIVVLSLVFKLFTLQWFNGYLVCYGNLSHNYIYI